MEDLTQVLLALTRCAEIGKSGASRVLPVFRGLPAAVSAALEEYTDSGHAQEKLLTAVQAAGHALLARACPLADAGSYIPLEAQPSWLSPPVTYRQADAVRQILRGHKSPDGLELLIENGTALRPELLSDWLDALSKKPLTELAVRALCAMGSTVLPAAQARWRRQDTPAGRALLCVFLALSDEDDLLPWIAEAERMLARQDIGTLTAVMPFLSGRAEKLDARSPAKAALYRFFAKLLPALICRPGNHIFLVGACLDAIAAYATPQSTAFLEEMLQLCEHQLLKEAYS